MRNMAMMMMRSLGNFAGGCIVQFAMDPDSEAIIAVEITHAFRDHLRSHPKRQVIPLRKSLQSLPSAIIWMN
jgi:hypothetical protein